MTRPRVLAAVAIAAAALAVVLLAGGGDEGRAPPAERAGAGGAPTAAVVDPRTGARLRPPEGWALGRRSGALRLTAPDRSAIVSVSAPGPAQDAATLLNEGVAALGEGLRSVRERRRRTREVAGFPATEVVLTARNRGGERLQVTVLAVRGRRRAYLIETFLSVPIARERLRQVRSLLASLALDA